MITLLAWLADVTPTPSPSPALNEDLVTPGIVGFVVTFFIAVATVLRRVRYRAEVQEQLEAEEREAAEGGKAGKPGKATPAPED